MLDKYYGCLVGAAFGSALGMSADQMPVRPMAPLAYGCMYGSHPNHALLPGQYSGDGVILLIASRNLAEGSFNSEEYGKELHRAFKMTKLRNPDGAIYSSCRKMDVSKDFVNSGVCSNTAGCMPLSIPFALRYRDRKEMAKAMVPAISVTHTGTGAMAATIGFALLLSRLIETGDATEGFIALESAAANLDSELFSHLQMAHHAAQAGMNLAEAAQIIGTISPVYQTLPFAMYLCQRYTTPTEILSAAVSAGGNSGTIVMLCGAYVGARYGYSSLPQLLLPKLERCSIFRELAEKFYALSYPEQVAKEETQEEVTEKKSEEKQEIEAESPKEDTVEPKEDNKEDNKME